jgi:hypothetical protein
VKEKEEKEESSSRRHCCYSLQNPISARVQAKLQYGIGIRKKERKRIQLENSLEAGRDRA